MTFVNGAAPFGSQCPFGSFSRPVDTPVSMWGCNLGLSRVELVQPLRPLIIQADCKKKLISVRSSDGKLDTLWEVMPDNSFYFTVDGGQAIFKDDGSDNTNCSTQLAAEMFGTMDCTDRDKVKIKLETVWWLDRLPPPPNPVPSAAPSPAPTVTPTPGPSASPTPVVTSPPNPATVVIMRSNPYAAASPRPGNSACKIPQGCYFYAAAAINQCE